LPDIAVVVGHSKEEVEQGEESGGYPTILLSPPLTHVQSRAPAAFLPQRTQTRIRTSKPTQPPQHPQPPLAAAAAFRSACSRSAIPPQLGLRACIINKDVN